MYAAPQKRFRAGKEEEVLTSTLGAEKARLPERVRAAPAQPAAARLRPEWARGL